MDTLLPRPEDMLRAFEEKKISENKVKRVIESTDDFSYACDLAAWGLPAAAWGTLLQSKLVSMFNWEGISQKLDSGDFSGKNHDLVELKISIAARGEEFNFLSLRLSSVVQHYLLIGRTIGDDKNLNCFFLSKEQLAYMQGSFTEFKANTNGNKTIGNLRVKSGIVIKRYAMNDAWSYLDQYAINFDNLKNI